MSNKVSVTLYNTDCFAAFAQIPDASIDVVITDPPYFLDQLGSEWETDREIKQTKSGQVKSLPAGMKFDPRQGIKFQEFMTLVGEQALRVLKPGGFFLAFSAPRLYHRLGVAAEDAGFHVRDMWSWLYTQNQVKAMSVARFLDTTLLSAREQKLLESELAQWKTPQIKSCLEPIVCAQKPPEGTYLENWKKYHVGLVNIESRVGVEETMVPANVMTTGLIEDAFDKSFLVPKPTRAEKGETNHISVKPLTLMDQLVRLVAPSGATVLDPFNGSGSTGISALRLGRSYIGFELSPIYYKQTRRRFTESFEEEGLKFKDISSQPISCEATITAGRLTAQASPPDSESE